MTTDRHIKTRAVALGSSYETESLNKEEKKVTVSQESGKYTSTLSPAVLRT